jgi:hypothetical protein
LLLASGNIVKHDFRIAFVTAPALIFLVALVFVCARLAAWRAGHYGSSHGFAAALFTWIYFSGFLAVIWSIGGVFRIVQQLV